MTRPVFGAPRGRTPTEIETPPERPLVHPEPTDFGTPWTEYEDHEVALARAMFEAWNAERGRQRRFIESGQVTWFALNANDRALWCAAARGAREYNDRTAVMDAETYNAILTEANSV